MKIFITGTESFVGQELIAQCEKANMELTGCDAKQPADKRFHQADIRSKNIIDIMPENVDAIIHLAALSTDPLCRDKAYECCDINVMGTLNLINAAQAKKARQFIFASTEWVYDSFKENEIKDEDSFINITNHTSEYALSKLVSEQNLRQKYVHGFCPVTILRFGIIYGPRKNNWSAVESLLDQVAKKDLLTVGSLKTGRHFIHVSDIASAIIKSIGLGGFEILNIQGDELITLGDVIETSKKITGKRPGVKENSPTKASIRNISNTKAKKMIKWTPEIGLEVGLNTVKILFG